MYIQPISDADCQANKRQRSNLFGGYRSLKTESPNHQPKKTSNMANLQENMGKYAGDPCCVSFTASGKVQNDGFTMEQLLT